MNRDKSACDASGKETGPVSTVKGKDNSFLASYLIYSNFMQLSFLKRGEGRQKKFPIPKQDKVQTADESQHVQVLYEKAEHPQMLTENR